MPAFPVDLKQFVGCLAMEQQFFDLSEGLTAQARTAGGQVIRAEGAERVWHGQVTIGAQRNALARGIHAKMHALRAAGASFYISDLTHKGPSISAAIATVQANGSINISGGPAGATLSEGDYISFNYNGIRALHQIVDSPNGWTLTSTGVRNGVEVVPPIRPGWTAGAAMTIGAAKCQAVMVPGSVRLGISGRHFTNGVSFEWVQLLRSAA